MLCCKKNKIKKYICFFIGCLRWWWFFLGRCQPPQIYNGTHTFRFQDSARNQGKKKFLNFAHDRNISNAWKYLKTLVFVYIFFGMTHKWICFSRSCLHEPLLTLNAQSLWGLARSLRYKTWAAYASVHSWCTPCAYFEIKQTTKLFGYNSRQTVQFTFYFLFSLKEILNANFAWVLSNQNSHLTCCLLPRRVVSP